MIPILDKPVEISTAGEERVIVSVLPDVPVDEEGTTTDQGLALENRTRVGLDLGREGWKLRLEGDLFSGQFAGQTWALPVNIDERHREDRSVLDADAFRARQLALEGRLGPVQLSAGLQTSHWGLGMVANDGAHDPTFGRSDFGDRVLRLRLATRPLGKDVPWTVALAGDRVLADDTARWADDQAAWQGVLATLYGTPKDAARGGLYGVYRHQIEPEGWVTQVGMIDLYGEGRLPLGDRWGLSGGLEAAGILGSTERSRSVAAPEGLKVRSAGATGYVGLDGPGEMFGAKLRAGWASGDGNPDDDTTHDFSMDRDLDAGMVIFDEVQAAINANTWAKLSDLEHTGSPPDGVDALVDEGAVKRALFLQPSVSLAPLPWAGLRLGLTSAWSTAPVANPYTTYRAGGTPTNQLGEPTEGYTLGTELDWALSLHLPTPEAPGEGPPLRPDLLVQGGHLLPSANLGLTGVHTLLMVQARARW